eukprot:1158994-Pelagomonas_calceolata.AAC.14
MMFTLLCSAWPCPGKPGRSRTHWNSSASSPTARQRDQHAHHLHDVHTAVQRMAMSWKAWKEWIVMKHKGELTNSKAAGYLRNVLLGRAWNTWLEHHYFVQTAAKVR